MKLAIDSSEILNGIDINRVGAILAGKGTDGASEQEKRIASLVRRKLNQMRRKGYGAIEGARYAKRLVVQEALRIR